MKLFLILFVLCVSACTKPGPCQPATISAVGGCDKYGICGVSYDDGSFGHNQYPAVGKRVCKN